MQSLKIKIIGILFLVAMFSSLAGGGIIESILNISEISEHLTRKNGMLKFGVSLEMINGFAVIAIGALFFKVLKRPYKTLGPIYFVLRSIEGIACICAAYLPLSLLKYSNSTLELNALNETILSIRMEISSIIVPVFFCLSAIILYTCLYKSKLVPQFISLWGFAGILGIALLNLINSESNLLILLALPIILNEIFLGIWLIVKGIQRIN